ncbi:MAG: helix-turn-helix domain-containing protein [Hyphomicrobiales bacterium]|nr:helix-turn-helix domain-containing protein [Hyphomicrobiales bacterium]MCP5372839.1 helix-turn-helix domain-containing protein [Hyphomicrobiales bacterium]
MTEVKAIRALGRGIEVLEWLGTRPGATLAQIHQGTGLSKATLLRILKTLAERGWVQRSLGDGAYRVTDRAFTFTNRVYTVPRIAELAAPLLRNLCDRVVWPSDLAVFDGRAMLILETSRLHCPFPVNRDVIGIRPGMLQSALGRAYLGFCPAEERDEILAKLRRSPDPDDRVANNGAWVAALVDQTLRQGYGVRETGYWTGNPQLSPDLSAIAVPVLVHGRVIACVNILWIPGSIKIPTAEFIATYLPHLKATAAHLSRMAEVEGSHVDMEHRRAYH